MLGCVDKFEPVGLAFQPNHGFFGNMTGVIVQDYSQFPIRRVVGVCHGKKLNKFLTPRVWSMPNK